MNKTAMGRQLLLLAVAAATSLAGGVAQAQDHDEPATALHQAADVPTATTSSKWGGDSAADPQNALKGDPTGRYSFHTEGGPNEWLMVDLKKEVVLESIKIFNRYDYWERAFSLEVYLAPEGSAPTSRDQWKLLYSNNGKPFRGVHPNSPAKDLQGREAPLVVAAMGKKARYIKLQLAKQDYLHLDKVQIKVQKASEPKKAASTPATDLLGNSSDPFAEQ